MSTFISSDEDFACEGGDLDVALSMTIPLVRLSTEDRGHEDEIIFTPDQWRAVVAEVERRMRERDDKGEQRGYGREYGTDPRPAP